MFVSGARRRLWGVDHRTPRQTRVGHRSAAYRPLWPSQVRTRRFSRVGFGRRGVDPAEVAEFLDRVAGDLSRAYAEVATVREQNIRIKSALRRWRSERASSGYEMAGR